MHIYLRHFLLFILTPFILAACNGGIHYEQIQGYAQGGTWHAICGLPHGVSRQEAQHLADSLLVEIDNSISGYNKGSLLSRLNAGETLPLDSHFVANFTKSREIWEASEGAFDPSSAPLFDLWGFGFTTGAEISDAAVDSIKAFVGMSHFALADSCGQTYLLRDDPRCKLNFNAIAQGYSCDCIAALLEELGCRDYLVEVGLEIVCKGRSARGGKWNVALEKPVEGAQEGEEAVQEILELTDCGIVTSGNYRKFYEKDGQKYAHTIDPKTGRPVTHHLLSATVIIPDSLCTMPGSTADACATWMMVIGTEKARAFAKEHPDYQVILLE